VKLGLCHHTKAVCPELQFRSGCCCKCRHQPYGLYQAPDSAMHASLRPAAEAVHTCLASHKQRTIVDIQQELTLNSCVCPVTKMSTPICRCRIARASLSPHGTTWWP
jgi:hypothetical protein